MEILEDYDLARGKSFNALNDVRVEGCYRFPIKNGTYFMFRWDTELEIWVFEPRRFFYETEAVVTNDMLLLRVDTPEEKGCVAQSYIRDMTNRTMAKNVMKIFDYMAKCQPPASADKLKNIREQLKTKYKKHP